MNPRRSASLATLWLSALLSLLAVSRTEAGPRCSLAWGASQHTTYGRAGVLVSINGWPTVITNSPRIGVRYGWTHPYYISPFRIAADGRVSWWHGFPPYTPRYGPGLPFFWEDSPWFWPRTYDGPPLVEIARRVDPALLNPPAPSTPLPPPLSASEMARQALIAREYDRAALVYARLAEEQRQSEASTSYPQQIDRTAERFRVLALAGARQFAIAAELLALANQEDPRDSGINGRRYISSPAELRRIVNAAVTWAHRQDSPAAWNLVAFLMDCEGRPDQAARMRERASLVDRGAAPRTAERGEERPIGPARFSMPAPTVEPAPIEPEADTAASQPKP